MLWSPIFRVLLKTSRLKFLYELYMFFFGGLLKCPDFIMVDMSIRWSEKPISKLLDNLNKFFLFVRVRSIQCTGCSFGLVTSMFVYSFVRNCKGGGGGSNYKFWGKKPSSSFNYYKRMT